MINHGPRVFAPRFWMVAPWEKAGETYRTAIDLIDPDGWWAARVKRDGCVDLRRYHNQPNDDDPDMADYIHICDLDELIERLQAIKKVALVNFGEWPE